MAIYNALNSARTRITLSSGEAGANVEPGILEDISFSPEYTSENLIGVGNVFPPDNVVNNTQGTIRFTAVFTNPRDADSSRVYAVLTPRLQRFIQALPFDVVVDDILQRNTLLVALGCRPRSFEVTMAGGRAARVSFNGICRAVLFGNEYGSAIPTPSAVPGR